MPEEERDRIEGILILEYKIPYDELRDLSDDELASFYKELKHWKLV